MNEYKIYFQGNISIVGFLIKANSYSEAVKIAKAEAFLMGYGEITILSN